MHWFNYVWIVPIAIALLVWAYFSICDVIATIRDYIAEKEAGDECGLLTFLDDWLEDYTKGFFATIAFVLMLSSFISFVWNCIPAE